MGLQRPPRQTTLGTCIGGRSRHASAFLILTIHPYRLTSKGLDNSRQAAHACRNSRIRKPNLLAVDRKTTYYSKLDTTLLPVFARIPATTPSF